MYEIYLFNLIKLANLLDLTYEYNLYFLAIAVKTRTSLLLLNTFSPACNNRDLNNKIPLGIVDSSQ